MLRPLLRRVSVSWMSRSISGGDSAVVGSSMISTRAPDRIARRTSTTCWVPRGYRSSGRRTSMSSKPSLTSCSSAIRLMAGQLTVPRAVVGCRPRNMFSATLSSGMTESSWWIIPIPRRSASRGERRCTGWPSIRYSPSYSE